MATTFDNSTEAPLTGANTAASAAGPAQVTQTVRMSEPALLPQDDDAMIGRESEVLTPKSALQREGIEYDRRQIRRKVRSMLQERDQDDRFDSSDDENNFGDDIGGLGGNSSRSRRNEDDLSIVSDEESVYEDTELYPWKQREAAVRAAAMGGQTEGRMEGFDSLERALQAHQHKLHYGRGKGFAWSLQQKDKNRSSLLLQKHRSTAAMTMAGGSEWQSFRNLDNETVAELSSRGGQSSTAEAPVSMETREMILSQKEEARRRKKMNLVNTLVLLVAICSMVGFAYFLTILKVDNYAAYLPRGYDKESGEPLLGQQGLNPAQNNLQTGTNQGNDETSWQPASATPGRALKGTRRVMAVDVVPAHDYSDEMERNRRARERQQQEQRRAEQGLESPDVIGITTEAPQEGHMRLIPKAQSESRLTTMKNFFSKYSAFETVASLKALQWIAREDRLRLAVPKNQHEESRLVQRFALATLFFATSDGHGWSDSAFFLQPASICEWKMRKKHLGVVGCNRQGLPTKLVLGT